MPTLRKILHEAEQQLLSGPHPKRARLDAESLLIHALAQDRAWLLANRDEEADPATQCTYTDLVNRRQTGEPIQYITGQSEFFGLPFSVGPGVLIPRPETEHLVEEVIRLAAPFPSPLIADIGTGSGIIAVALAHALPHAQITAIDCSPQALTIARENATSNQVANRITFLEGDLLAPPTQSCHPEQSEGSASPALSLPRFHIIASNPPYIPATDRESLSVEVRNHEPHSALFAGEEGLAIYQRLIPEARHHLIEHGWLVLEIGHGQQPAIEALLQANSYREIHFFPDYQGIPRVAAARLA